MAVAKIAYGTEDGKNFYVQTVCDHTDCQNCKDTRGFKENFTEKEAKEFAEKKARKLKVPVVKW